MRAPRCAPWPVLAFLAGSCAPGRAPPSNAEAAAAVETFLVHEIQGNAAKAWALLGPCHVDQSSETTYVVLRANPYWRMASHDTTLVMIEYDALGDVLPVPPRLGGGRDTLFTFRADTRRIGETFPVTWDSAGKPALVCGLHRANHIQVARFRREQFTTADGSRARWDSVRALP